jgi:23S rRNA pseudouridine1911/1915/1917 synthase
MATRTFVVSQAEAGRAVAAFLKARLPLSWSAARRLVDEGRVHFGRGMCRNAAQRLKPGQKIHVHLPAGQSKPKARGPRPTAHGPKPIIRYADAHVVVVDKPAGLTTMRHAHEAEEFGDRARRFLPATLAELLPELLPGRPRLRAVHRLDKDTSGLVLFARTAAAERDLGRQFRAHGIGRRYLAVIRGRAQAEAIESYLVPDRGDGRRGSTPVPGAGKRAVTHVRVLEDLGNYTLVECRLETGRTHQVRIHLGEHGTPICGERVYDRPPHGAPLPDASGSPRLALHAAELAFTHPANGKRLTWTSPLPADLKALVARLRRVTPG